MIERGRVRQTIAEVYDTESAARAVLLKIKYPVSYIPPWDKPDIFWSNVIQDLDRGRINDGVAELIRAARTEFPGNDELHALMPDQAASTAPAQPLSPARPRDAQHDQIASSEPATREVNNFLPAIPAVPRPRKWRLPRLGRANSTSHVSVKDVQSIHFLTGKRRPEELDTEVHDYNNSGSSATSVETLRIAHSAHLVFKFDTAHASLRSGEAGVSILDFAKLQGRLQSSLRTQYSLSQENTLTVERTSQVNVPARKHVQVTLKWKRIWQDGTIVIGLKSGHDLLIPYSVTVGLVFDKSTKDVVRNGTV
jgi:Effector-associated domain 1